VCVCFDVDEGNNEGVCDDVLDMEKIVTGIAERIHILSKDNVLLLKHRPVLKHLTNSPDDNSSRPQTSWIFCP
jgi:hypothetical protein